MDISGDPPKPPRSGVERTPLTPGPAETRNAEAIADPDARRRLLPLDAPAAPSSIQAGRSSTSRRHSSAVNGRFALPLGPDECDVVHDEAGPPAVRVHADAEQTLRKVG